MKLPPAPKKANPLDKITPVTDALLQNPPTGEWLTWRRGFDDQGFSPLKQITKSNVNNLRVAWTWTLSPGSNEATPLVHDGVMFLHSPGDKLEALDAATGDLLWQYARILPPGVNAGNKRAISIYGNKVYMATSDVHAVALDVKTGRVVWDQPLTEERGFNLSGGPLVAKGKVMIGTSGRVGGKNYIVALDAETGNLAWRFNTIAQPGEPGGDTWNDHTAEERNGGSVWIAGSYDSALNLAFFGVAQTYDTALLVKPVRPGVKTDGLYTDCTLAINPDTGKLVWYYQHLPNDQWDLDWVFERQIVRMPVNGVVRPVIMTSGKQATYDVLDAETGKWIYSKDLGLQNIVSSIDPVTGKKTINPQTMPGDGQSKMVCPHVDGAKSWIPGSYNPDTKIMYVPLVEACMDLTPVTDGGRRPLVHRRSPHRAASSGFGRQVRPGGSHQHGDARSGVDRAPSRAGVERRAGYGRRGDLQRLDRSVLPRLRRPDRQTAVGNASDRCAEQRPDFVHGERQAVHRYRRGQRRRAGDGVRGAGAGNPEPRPCSGGVGVPTALIGVISPREFQLCSGRHRSERPRNGYAALQ